MQISSNITALADLVTQLIVLAATIAALRT